MKIFLVLSVLLSFSAAFAEGLSAKIAGKNFCALIANDVDAFQLSCDGVEIDSPSLKNSDYLSFSAVSAELIGGGLKLVYCIGDTGRGTPKLCGFARQ